MNIKNIKELKELNQSLKTKYMESNLHDYEVKDLDEVLKKAIEKILATSFKSDYLSSKYGEIVNYCLENNDISESEIANLKKVSDEKAEKEKQQKLYSEAFDLIWVNAWTKKSRLQKRNTKSLSIQIYANYSYDMFESITRYLTMLLGEIVNDNTISDDLKRIEGRDNNYNTFWFGEFQYESVGIQLFKNKSCVFTFETQKERDLAFERIEEFARLSGRE